MGRQDIIATPRENVLEKERRKKRLLEVAFEEKGKERFMLKRKKQEILAKEAGKKKVVDDFMVFITAIENNDLQTAQNFDEKAMMNTIATMLNGDVGDNGGLAGGYGDIINLLGIDLGPEEKAWMDAIIALENAGGSCGGDDRGFAEDHGGINNTPENAQNFGEEDKMTAIEGTKNDGGEGSSLGSYDGSHKENRCK